MGLDGDTGDRTPVVLFTNQRLVGGLKGGMERHMELLAQYIDRERFQVFGVVPEWDSMTDFARSFGEQLDGLVRLTIDRDHKPNVLRLYRQLRSWRARVMHVHNPHFLGQNLAIGTARLAGVRRIFVSEHTPPDAPVAFRFRAATRVMAELSTGLVAVSDYNLKARQQYLYTPPSKTVVVENGIDTGSFARSTPAELAALRARHDIPPNAPVVGTVVRFEEDKGLTYLVDAMPRIVEACPDVHFLMVGDGSLRAALEARAERLGVLSRVRFIGWVADPRPYLSLMDAFVLPVPMGSASIAMLEAMAMGCAAVITFGGEREAVVHRETGMRALPRDPVSIAENVIPIVSDPAFREKLGQAARRHVEQHFSARSTAQKLEQLYAPR